MDLSTRGTVKLLLFQSRGQGPNLCHNKVSMNQTRLTCSTKQTLQQWADFHMIIWVFTFQLSGSVTRLYCSSCTSVIHPYCRSEGTGYAQDSSTLWPFSSPPASFSVYVRLTGASVWTVVDKHTETCCEMLTGCQKTLKKKNDKEKKGFYFIKDYF